MLFIAQRKSVLKLKHIKKNKTTTQNNIYTATYIRLQQKLHVDITGGTGKFALGEKSET